MKLHHQVDRLAGHRTRKVQKRKPLVELFEPRILLTSPDGFLQGYVLTNSQTPLPEPATISLYNSSNAAVGTETTSPTGYYSFNNTVIAPGQYTLKETALPAGYTVGAADPLTTINPASVVGTSISVTVEDLSAPAQDRNINTTRTPKPPCP